MNKFFMLGLAGLAFAACSNEDAIDNGNPTPKGSGAVTIRIANPSVATKAITDPTAGTAGETTILIDGTLTIELYEASNVNSPAQKMTLPALDVTTATELTFWNVTDPYKIAVHINDGQYAYNGTGENAVDITTLQMEPEQIPAYGETTTFTLTAETGSPIIANDNDNNDVENPGNKQEQGANEGDQNKVYQIYTAQVKMAIPVARLEIGNITHVDHASESTTCEYSNLTVKGTYMDHIYTVGGTYTGNGAANSTYTLSAGNPANYYWADGIGQGDAEKILYNEYETSLTFIGDEPVTALPENDQVYAYNFYVGANAPQFKIYFDSSEGSNVAEPRPAPRFAMITKYTTDGTNEVTFEPGKIYRIKSAVLNDENIIGDEEGNTLYGVTVTVTEATWSIVDIQADWAQ